jgi:hypothetical protein
MEVGMKKSEALFNLFPNQTDKHGRTLPFWACGKVVADKRFTDERRCKMREITIETIPPDPAPGSQQNGTYQRVRFRIEDLGRNGQRDFRGIKVSVTQYVFRWEFRGKSYRVDSDGPKIKPIGHGKR